MRDTPVIVFIPQNSSFGYILASVPDIVPEPILSPANQLVSESGTATYCEKDAFNHRDWNNGKKLPTAGAGTVVDAFSGDQGTMNDLPKLLPCSACLAGKARKTKT